MAASQGLGLGLLPPMGMRLMDSTPPATTTLRAAGADAQIGLGDGFKAGSAEAVDGDAGDFDRKPGAQSGKAGDVPALLAFGLRAAEDDVVDRRFCRGREPGPKLRSRQLRRGRRGERWRARLWGRGQRGCERRRRERLPAWVAPIYLIYAGGSQRQKNNRRLPLDFNHCRVLRSEAVTKLRFRLLAW